MKERPILFFTPMIVAIINGTKTDTRRVVRGKGKYKNCEITEYIKSNLYRDHIIFKDNGGLEAHFSVSEFVKRFSPYQKDDELWVKETYAIDTYGKGIVYRATQNIDPDYPIKWKPSLFMFKKYSRIRLKVVGVGIERLQDISKEDALKEGIFYTERYGGYVYDAAGRGFHGSDPAISFYHLWEFLNGKRGYSWGQNPYVWKLSFVKIK